MSPARIPARLARCQQALADEIAGGAFAAGIEVRVDGSAWTTVTVPLALTGHKFRITDGTNQAVLTSLIPCSVFLRPGIDGAGLVAWAHWGTSGSDAHALTIDLAPPP